MPSPYLVPIALLFVTLQLSTLQPSTLTQFLSLLSFFGFFLTALYRTKGLILSYGAIFGFIVYFYRDLPPETLLWQFTLYYGVALTLFIVLLMSESIEQKEHLQKAEFSEEERKYKEYIDSLKEMIQELTQELEQRRIDRVEVEEEPDLLALKREHAQLRRQFEEKQMILSQTRAQLFDAETKLLALEKEQIEDISPSLKSLEREWLALYEEHLQLEEEVLLLERLLS